MTSETKEEGRRSDRSALPSLRGFYFFSFAALGAFFPFLPLLLESRGLTPTRITWLMALIPLSNLLVPPVWGALADARSARLGLLRLACLGSALTLLLMIPRWGFTGSALALGVFSIFRAPLTSLGDAMAYAALGGRRPNFSAIRVFGSLGFALLVLVSGWLAEGSAPEASVVVMTAALYAAAGLSTLPLRPSPHRAEPRVLAQATAILRRPPVILFLAANAVYYGGHAIYDACFSLHLRAIGHGEAFIGAAWAVGVGVEIALMLLAPRFFHGARAGTWLVLCALIAALRWSLLSFVRGEAAVLAVQGLHGVTFGLWYLSLVKFSQERAPEPLRASLQSITAASMGLGMVLGYLAGGPMLEEGGGELVFRAAATAALTALILYGASLALRGREAVDDQESERP